MKKRLLALALCLVMMTSLLPLTAAAAGKFYTLQSLTLIASGVEKRNDRYYVNFTSWKAVCDDGGELNKDNMPNYYIEAVPINKSSILYDETVLTDSPVEEKPYYVLFYTHTGGVQLGDQFVFSNSFSANLEMPGYTAKMLPDLHQRSDGFQVEFKLTKTEHTWQYTVSESGSKLTAECLSCNIAPVTVKLNAHSVTLPDDPFNATVETSENFKEEFTYSDIEYKYNDSGVWKVVDPKTFTPKPGEYQAKVYINSLSGNGGAVARASSNGSPNYVYVKYTAADPKVTAQTGDNRPIELMVGSVVVFSALAAAFVADSKRKYQQ